MLSELGLPPLQSYGDLFKPIRSDNPAFILFFVVSCDVALGLWKRWILGQSRAKIPFALTDYWALIVTSLTAYMVLFDITSDYRDFTPKKVGLIALIFTSVAYSIQGWFVLTAPLTEKQSPSRSSHIFSIAIGVVTGIFNLFFLAIAFEFLNALVYACNFRYDHAICSYPDVYDPIPVENIFFLAFWLMLFGGGRYLLKRRMLGQRQRKIQFFITDYWAAILALLPSFFLLAERTNELREIDLKFYITLALVTLSILSGMWVHLIIRSCRAVEENRPSRGARFTLVLLGGAMGLLGLFAAAIVFRIGEGIVLFSWTVVYLWLRLCYLAPPLIFISIVCFRIHKKAYDLLFR